jgi:transposase InsO family protein
MVSYATIYRIFKQHGVSESDHVYPDRRRFEAELPNDIWQSDCLHGPKVLHEGRMKKAYLFAFIDDMSRLIPHGEFYLTERIDCYIDALTKALAKRELPRKLYVDNGPAFSTQVLRHAMASLGIALIHSRPYQPEGRGKIERFLNR